MDIELGVGEDDIVMTGDRHLGRQTATRGPGSEGDVVVLEGRLAAVGGGGRAAVGQYGLERGGHLYLGHRGQIDVKVVVKEISPQAAAHILQIILGDRIGELQRFGLFGRLGGMFGRQGRQKCPARFPAEIGLTGS